MSSTPAGPSSSGTSSSGSSRKRNSTSYVDCEMAKRGVWLVKVPRYLSDIWEANGGSDVGKLVLEGQGSKVKLVSRANLTIPEHVVRTKAGASSSKIPEEHSFVIRDIPNQTMAVLSEDKTGLNEDANIRSGRLTIDGKVMKRAECRPPDSNDYLKMKIAQIELSGQPKKFVKVLDKAALNYKPVNQHEEDKMRIKQKKDGAKSVRIDREVLMQQLFHAFEKHQYYRLQDLQQVTQQPANYVKELLQEIAVYNTAPPHKSLWELKPEYRNYEVKD